MSDEIKCYRGTSNLSPHYHGDGTQTERKDYLDFVCRSSVALTNLYGEITDALKVLDGLEEVARHRPNWYEPEGPSIFQHEYHFALHRKQYEALVESGKMGVYPFKDQLSFDSFPEMSLGQYERENPPSEQKKDDSSRCVIL